jgi:hypothetical protein
VRRTGADEEETLGGDEMGQTTLGGLLQATTIQISPAQILALPGTPIQLVGPPAGGFANILKSVLASLRFATTPYTAPASAFPYQNASLFYNGQSRIGVAGGSQLGSNQKFLSLAVTAVAGASGATVYTVTGLSGVPSNILAGFLVSVTGCSHAANNGAFVATANAAGTITLANGAGIAESAPPEPANCTVYASATLVGGNGATIDLSNLLASTTSTVAAFNIPTFGNWQFPTTEIQGAGIFLGTALSSLAAPQTNFTSGDGSLLVTLEFLQVPL